jgi:hypothetical protein
MRGGVRADDARRAPAGRYRKRFGCISEGCARAKTSSGDSRRQQQASPQSII